jgi:outer membrane protein OmpA-like peptidoglycan-associated protein
LGNRDLNRRIRMLRQAERDKRLKPGEIEVARRLVEEDRLLLRQRYRDNRERRRHYYERNRATFVFGINVIVPPPYDIAAAEAGDQELFDQLVAAPRFRPQRAYTFDEVVRNDEVRRAMPGIEIDTVTFDFGSAELGPEQIDQLEGVAGVIEKVLAVRPDEVFLIEGHTDAVGSEEANQRLSEARAQSVMAALADYFAIDPANLRTVGLGERFLKIPTEEPEQENRRVTVRRITPMLTGRVQ